MSKPFETLNPMAVYAEGINHSNYIQCVAPLIKNVLTNIGDLLDVGAGAGQLGASLSSSEKQWVTIEPDPYMRNCLKQYPNCSQIIASGWQEVTDLPAQSFDTVLAANMIAPQAQANQFLERCRYWSRNAIIWLVPSQRGPKNLCLAGCLPEEWINEENVTGYGKVISQLSISDYPDHTLTADWTFNYITNNIDQIATHMANQLDWGKTDLRRTAMRDHLYNQSIREGQNYHLQVAKQSTILIWLNIDYKTIDDHSAENSVSTATKSLYQLYP